MSGKYLLVENASHWTISGAGYQQSWGAAEAAVELLTNAARES